MTNIHKTTMMRNFLLTALLFLSQQILAQSAVEGSNSFIITGKVKAEKRVNIADLQGYKTIALSDINTSCSPKKQEKAKYVKAVLVKDILDSVAFQYERSRMLNQYYFLFIASDDYKMVFSFNEIYNTDIGNNLFIVTEMDGIPVQDMENKMLVLSTKDIKSGSRNMKWLSKIVVCSAE